MWLQQAAYASMRLALPPPLDSLPASAPPPPSQPQEDASEIPRGRKMFLFYPPGSLGSENSVDTDGLGREGTFVHLGPHRNMRHKYEQQLGCLLDKDADWQRLHRTEGSSSKSGRK